MNWIIYVANATTKNFNIGLKQGVWGHREIFSTVNTDKVKVGDTLYFVHHLTFMRDEDGNVIKGAPRVAAEHYKGSISTLVKARVTKGFYIDKKTVWTDDVYPNRYHFEVLEKHQNLPFGDEFFSSQFIQAVRTSTLTKGLAIELEGEHCEVYASNENIDLEYFEGNTVYRRHVVRERSAKLVSDKKRSVRDANLKLACEVCEFDFEETYGERGYDYIECHHKNPLSESNGQKTKLSDLALLCSNCHRIIHRSRPWISVDRLREILNERT
ncbi:HNH domain-containing protein [Vibrio chagasii]|nr:HNH domain-containing protein [Vibrio chagasii]CAH7249162.1 HNH domain-containing protein [Vibrio chagasii]CAH7268128.1 HNH domain-containing protein [Vibrio chagasii]CAH7455322.1 HNH domain-containing protein [Vibrio chagasii]